MEAWRQRVIDITQTWLKTRWHHNARVRGAGVDCGQLIIAAYVEAGLFPDFKTGHYSCDWMLHRSEERYLGYVEERFDRVAQPLPADVAVWKYGRCFSHGAIVTAWPTIIHAWRPEGCVTWGDAERGALARNNDGTAREVRFYSIAGRL